MKKPRSETVFNFLFGSLSCLFVLFAPAFAVIGQAEAAEITLVHTSNVTGHLFACPS